MEIKEKYALITGATSGIGYELAKLFAKDGYNLVIVARDKTELTDTMLEIEQQYSVKVLTIIQDLFDYQNAFKLYEQIKARKIKIDVLVNNAGHGHYGEFADTDIEQQLQIVHLNICSMMVLTKLYVDEMLQHGKGKILNLSSIASKSPGPWHSVYHGTMAFIQSFTEAIRQEVKDKGITVTALLPGVTDTDFFRKAEMEDSKAVQYESQMSDPEHVAKDGFDALMAGKDKVISGFRNKIEVALTKFSSDEKNAEKMAKQQEPVHEKE